MTENLEGTTLDGKYQVERVLGRGGMGMVLSAVHMQLGQRVALKLLLPEVCANKDAVDRFLREARAAVRIQSEHVARVSDVGTLATGEPYMVMEFLQGSDLGQVLRARGPLPVTEAVDYVLQACVAVAEAHVIGIVHRDLKPANLFLTQRSDRSALVKVLDFGISKAMHGGLLAESASATASAVIMGSPQYMSPEQTISSRDVDVRSDIWSLGMILHEMMTGMPMYQAESPTAVLIMISTVPATPLRSLRADAPPELERVLLRCLEKNREKRYPDVAALARALGRFASDGGRTYVERIARILGTDASGATGDTLSRTDADAGPATGGPWGHTQASKRRKRYGWVVAAAGGAVAVLGAILFFALRTGNVPASTPANEKPAAAAPPLETPAPEPIRPIDPTPPAELPQAEPAPMEPAPLRMEPPAVRYAEPAAETRLRPAPAKPKPKPAQAPRPARGKDLFDDPK